MLLSSKTCPFLHYQFQAVAELLFLEIQQVFELGLTERSVFLSGRFLEAVSKLRSGSHVARGFRSAAPPFNGGYPLLLCKVHFEGKQERAEIPQKSYKI